MEITKEIKAKLTPQQIDYIYNKYEKINPYEYSKIINVRILNIFDNKDVNIILKHKDRTGTVFALRADGTVTSLILNK